MKKGELDKHAQSLLEEAQKGDAETQWDVACNYNTGAMSFPEDKKEAARWCRLAAEQGHARAQAALGWMYALGEGVPKDETEARKWWKKEMEAQRREICGSGGFDAPKDEMEARKWWRKAAERGDAQGQFKLGVMYQDGRGVTQDFKEALKWFCLAAEQGNAEAQFEIGDMHRTGIGVPEDVVAAYAWYNMAASNGFDIAGNNKDLLAKEMNHEQISEAQKLSRELIKQEEEQDASPDFSNPLNDTEDLGKEKEKSVLGMDPISVKVKDTKTGQAVYLVLRSEEYDIKGLFQEIFSGIENKVSAPDTTLLVLDVKDGGGETIASIYAHRIVSIGYRCVKSSVVNIPIPIPFPAGTDAVLSLRADAARGVVDYKYELSTYWAHTSRAISNFSRIYECLRSDTAKARFEAFRTMFLENKEDPSNIICLPAMFVGEKEIIFDPDRRLISQGSTRLSLDDIEVERQPAKGRTKLSSHTSEGLLRYLPGRQKIYLHWLRPDSDVIYRLLQMYAESESDWI